MVKRSMARVGVRLLVALVGVSSLSAATTFNLSSVGIESGQSGTTDLVMGFGTVEANLLIDIDFDPNEVILDASGIVVDSGSSGVPGFVERHTVINGNKLRIILFEDPSTLFGDSQRTLLRIPWSPPWTWEPPSSPPVPHTDLSVTIEVTDQAGNPVEAHALGARIHYIDAVEGRLVTDLSQWTYLPAIVSAGALGSSFPGDAEATGNVLVDDGSDGSGADLLLDIGTADGDSLHAYVSPLGMISFEQGSTYRLEWSVASAVTPLHQQSRLRTRWSYGSRGELGSGNQEALPLVAPPGSGTLYTQLFDHLDVAGASETLVDGNPSVSFTENSITLFFEQIDLLDSFEGDLELESLEITRFEESEILTNALLEGDVADFTVDASEVDGAEFAEFGVDVTRAQSDATITASLDNGAAGLTVYGDLEVSLSERGVGINPFTPNATTGRFYRATWDVDATGNAGSLPPVSMRVQTFSSSLISPLYTTQLLVNSKRDSALGGPGGVNPAYDGLENYSAYLVLPSGLALDGSDPDGPSPGGPLLGLGDQITASVQLQDLGDEFEGAVTVTGITVSSIPEDILP